MMKVVLLHPPMYPINHVFYNMLAQEVNLVVYQIGEHPVMHTTWRDEKIRDKEKTRYTLKILGRGPVTLLNTMQVSYLSEILKERPDIVMSIAFWLPSLYVAMMRKIFSFKYIILTNAIPQTESNISIKQKIARKIICKNVDLLISASYLTTDLLQDMCANKKIVTSMQTIDVLEWKKKLKRLKSREVLRKKLFLDSKKIIMLGVGNYEQKKNWLSVLNILDNIDNVFFVLIGHGSQESLYNKIVHEKKLSDKILIAGRKDGDALLEYYKASDFLIFPSMFDQFGFVVPEALASGLPVICSKNAGSVSLIEDDYNGYVIDPENFNVDILEKMLLNIDRLRQNMTSKINKLTLENRVKEFTMIFNKLKKG